MRVKCLVLVAVAALCVLGWTSQAGAQVYTSAAVQPQSCSVTAPPSNCTTWQAKTAAGDSIAVHQDDYRDNGDGVVSVCDYIQLDGVWYHIISVTRKDCTGAGRLEVGIEGPELPATNQAGLVVLVLLLVSVGGTLLLRNRLRARANLVG